MIFGKKTEDNDVAALKTQNEQLESQNEIMREALEFYADPNNWEVGHKYRDTEDATIFTDGSNSAVTVDKGHQAASALDKIK